MSPPCRSFDAEELPKRVQEGVDGRRRKLDAGAKRVELSACEPLQMSQYDCELKDPSDPKSPIYCQAVERFFRKCKDRKGTFMVETTAWEDTASDSSKASKTTAGQTSTLQWPASWHNQ